MIDYLKQHYKDIFEKIKQMSAAALRTRFIIGVIIGIVATAAFSILALYTQAFDSWLEFIVFMALGLISLSLGIFYYILDWKAMFLLFYAPLKSDLPRYIIYVVNFSIALMIIAVMGYVVSISALIHMSSMKEGKR